MFSVLRGEEGQGLAEYALIVSLIAMAAIFALMFIAGNLSAYLSSVAAAL